MVSRSNATKVQRSTRVSTKARGGEAAIQYARLQSPLMRAFSEIPGTSCQFLSPHAKR